MCFAAPSSDVEHEIYDETDLLDTTPTTFSHPGCPYQVIFKKPSALHESVIASDTRLIISYIGLKNRLQASVSLLFDPELQATFSNYDEFRQLILYPFNDKEQQLYGEYTILQEQSDEKRMELTLRGFLKKAADSYLPAMYNFMLERDVSNGTVAARAVCQILGTQEQQQESAALFNKVEPLCSQFIDSLRLEKVIKE